MVNLLLTLGYLQHAVEPGFTDHEDIPFMHQAKLRFSLRGFNLFIIPSGPLRRGDFNGVSRNDGAAEAILMFCPNQEIAR